MTTVNHRLKALSFLLVLCMLASALLSCGSQSEELPFELLGDEALTEPGIAAEPFSAYRIVLPTSCSATLYSTAKQLAERLTTQTGVASEVFYDTEATAPVPNTFDLLLGKCNRSEAKRALAELRRDDYLCQATASCAVLGGNSEEATLAALTRFYQELFAQATASSLMSETAGFSFSADYEISSITVNGFELFEYTILYDSDASAKELALAKHLQESIRTKGAYMLDLCALKDFQTDHKQIYLTVNPEEPKNTYRIFSHEQGITISAHDLFGLSLAVPQWLDRLLSPDENRCVALSLESQETISYSNTAYTVSSLWLPSQTDSFLALNTLADTVKLHLPDLILTNRISAQQMTTLTQSLASNYETATDEALLRAGASCQKVSDHLYQMGEGEDAFLLLVLDHFPANGLPEALKNRTLPLVVFIHASAAESANSAAFFAKDHLMQEVFEPYQIGTEHRIFTVYTEIGSFATVGIHSDGDYRAITLKRLSALYPHPS